MHDLGQDQLRLCYSEFRKHRIQRHDLQEWDTTSQVHWDLENWLLTLIKTQWLRHVEQRSQREAA